MPQCVKYIARRKVVSGHTEGNEYTMNLYVTDVDDNRDITRDQVSSLSGVTYTTYHNGRDVYAITTRPLTQTEAAEMREFLASAEDGQTVSFSPTGWAGASPDGFIHCVLKDRSGARRTVKQGGDQSGDRFSFSFTLVEVP